jgi:hypothetical protein
VTKRGKGGGGRRSGRRRGGDDDLDERIASLRI